MKMTERMVRVADGVELHTWVFEPTDLDGPRPAITMAHGFAGVKYRGLKPFAERFAQRGFVVTVHDHRGFGLSTGPLRGDVDPWLQIANWRKVISFVETLDSVDPERIGLWGSSYAGGHALVLGATDRRLKAIVAQIPTISGWEQGLRRASGDARVALNRRFDEDERAQFRGEPPAMQLIYSTDPNVQASFRSQAALDYVAEWPLPDELPASDHVTLQSTRRAQMYEPGQWIDRVSPTPLLMVVGDADMMTPTDMQLAAYERALQPKKLQLFEGGHFDAYSKAFAVNSGAAEDWFVEHLKL